MAIKPLNLKDAYRLTNHGPTTFISASAERANNVMTAAWISPLDFDKVSLVLELSHFTYDLMRRSGRFGVSIATAAQGELLVRMGSTSRYDDMDKLANVELFYQPNFDVPLVAGSAAWMVCDMLPDLDSVRKKYGLVLAQVVGAWADERIFTDGKWKFDEADESLRTLHHVANGQFYAIGKGIKFEI